MAKRSPAAPKTRPAPKSKAVPRIVEFKVQNYRAIKDLTVTDVKPLSVFLGPNGSGKSTLFDVFAFLSECFTGGLKKAWDKRGRFKELRTRGQSGNIVLELRYREHDGGTPITYRLAIGEDKKGAFVAEEALRWSRKGRGRPFKFLDLKRGEGSVVAGKDPDDTNVKDPVRLSTPDTLAVNTLGQLKDHPRVEALRKFIVGWHLSYLTADNTRGTPDAGPQERLSATGDNLSNVIQFLLEQHGEALAEVLDSLSRRVPQLESVTATPLADGRLLLRVKDAPFKDPVLAKYASDGTLKMLAYLVALHDPDPPQLLGIEEPENHLHPRLLQGLAEECRAAAANSQVMVTTHSPFFVNGLQPDELWVLYRDSQGFTQAKRVADMPGVADMHAHGDTLGALWMDGYFDAGDPLTNSGMPRPKPVAAKA